MNLVCLPRRLLVLGGSFMSAAILSACGISSTSQSYDVTTTSTTQYLEIFSTVPSYKIPSGVYVVGINGQANSLSSTAMEQILPSVTGERSRRRPRRV